MMAPVRPPFDLPARLWIVGPPGSGKSTLAEILAAGLGIAPTSLDDLHWEPGWIERSWEDLRARVEPVVRGPSWVVEGNYDRVRRPLIERADLVVWLDLPLSVCLPRLLARTFDRALRGTPCCNGNREGLLRTFTTKESILWWALTMDRGRRAQLELELAGLPHVRLRHPAAVGRWLSASRPSVASVSGRRS